MPTRLVPRPTPVITPRQEALLCHLANGLTLRAAAAALVPPVHEITAIHDLRPLVDALEAASLTQIVRKAIAQGLIKRRGPAVADIYVPPKSSIRRSMELSEAALRLRVRAGGR